MKTCVMLLGTEFFALNPASAQSTAAEWAVQWDLSIDDLFAMGQIDRVAISPDGEWVAVVIRAFGDAR